MKRFGVIHAALVSLAVLGVSASGYAQREQQNDKQPKREEQAKPEKQQSNQPRQSQNSQQHAQQQERQSQNHEQHAQQRQSEGAHHSQLQRTHEQQRSQEHEQRGAWHERRAHSWESEHRTWQQRGGYSGYRVPDDYYRGHYGRDHWFRVYSLPFVQVGGFPRFQYGGYWFSAVDPYPEYWGDDWYQTDDVYVSYFDNGYYLYNRRYPGRPGVAISVSF